MLQSYWIGCHHLLNKSTIIMMHNTIHHHYHQTITAQTIIINNTNVVVAIRWMLGTLSSRDDFKLLYKSTNYYYYRISTIRIKIICQWIHHNWLTLSTTQFTSISCGGTSMSNTTIIIYNTIVINHLTLLPNNNYPYNISFRCST